MKAKQMKMGQGLVEYALILAGIAVVTVLALRVMGVSIREVYCRIASEFGGLACDFEKDCSFAFDTAEDLNAWEGTSPDRLVIEDGKACILGDGNSAATYLNSACRESMASDDYTIALDGITVDRYVQNNKNTGFDTWFRAQDDQNGYLFIYNSHTNYVRFWKIVNGKWIRLDQLKVPSSWQNEEINFRVDVQGDTFKAYRDDQLLLEATDSAYTDGAVGMRNKPSSKSCVADVSITKITK